MSSNFKIDNFNITTSLTDSSVYMRVLNNISFQCYENNVDIRDLKLPFPKEQIYDILNKCFSKTLNYDVIFLVKNDMLNLTFNILLEGLYKLNFNVILKEKILSNDTELTVNINQIDAKYEEKIKELENKIKELNTIVDCLTNSYITYPNTQMIQLNSKELSCNSTNNSYLFGYGIECFVKLEKFYINHDNGTKCFKDFNKIFSNSNLKMLCISNISSLTSFEGIEERFPNIETLEIHSKCYINSSTLNYLKKLNNLKLVKFVSCTNDTNMTSLIEYCKQNKIKVEF